jgi:hypothetical protein
MKWSEVGRSMVQLFLGGGGLRQGLNMYLRLASNLQSSCLSPPGARITDVHHTLEFFSIEH